MAGKSLVMGGKKKRSTIVLPRSPSVHNEIVFLLTALGDKTDQEQKSLPICLYNIGFLTSSGSGITSD